jgi:hypothetical protein
MIIHQDKEKPAQPTPTPTWRSFSGAGSHWHEQHAPQVVPVAASRRRALLLVVGFPEVVLITHRVPLQVLLSRHVSESESSIAPCASENEIALEFRVRTALVEPAQNHARRDRA